ncbi:hypothetical protein GCM10027290_59890 [Micromonospora sonneratiae]|uniref:4Fe-4S Wbl-type domain-containing protein n=1 Tax=Micromonospora sonneratiae TaxID=1184706 RepID=A0ABW3YQP7_9ACTN
MMGGPYAGEPVPLSDRLAEHYRETLAIHSNDPGLGACAVCLRSRCDEWRWAYEQLVAAGRLTDLPGPVTTGDAAGDGPGKDF